MKKRENESLAGRVAKCIGIFFCVALGLIAVRSALWVTDNFGLINPEQLLLNVLMPAEGVSTDFVADYLATCLPLPLVVAAVVAICLADPLGLALKVQRKNKKNGQIKQFVFSCNGAVRRWGLAIGILLLVGGLGFGMLHLELPEYLKNRASPSSFIEDHYADPKQAELTFPEQKRNLIYIYLESVETSFLTQEVGGGKQVELMPGLTALAQEHLNFSNTEKLGGAVQINGTNWTIAAMTAHSLGVPLKLPVSSDAYAAYEDFLPGAWGIGDILAAHGYNQMLMVGSNAAYGGRDNLYTQHGNYDIWDYVTAKDSGHIPPDYLVWWGMEDQKLYSAAKEQILGLASRPEPFNFTMLTVDTHHIGGYFCDLCRQEHGDQFSDVMSCADRQICEFITWLSEQEFYENTTVIITGDHLSMDPTYFEDLPQGYVRTTLNVFINAAATPVNVHNRLFTTMDMFPTALAALGVQIRGDRLALGTNLFSQEATWPEIYGLEKFKTEVLRPSSFYDQKLLYGQ